MAIPLQSVFTLATPRRPSIADLGGAAFTDDQEFEPDDTMPSAAMENQNEWVLQATEAVTPVLRLSVTWNGSAYVLTYIQSKNTNVTGGTFTPTRNSAGNISITWPANTFPAPAGFPSARLVTAALLYNATITAQNITNGVQIFITAGTSGSAAAAGSDQSFTVDVH